jgi:hypothetical protein
MNKLKKLEKSGNKKETYQKSKSPRKIRHQTSVFLNFDSMENKKPQNAEIAEKFSSKHTFFKHDEILQG